MDGKRAAPLCSRGAALFFLGGVCTCRAGPMCPAAGYAFFGGARGPRPTGRYVEPRVGDGVPDVPFRTVLVLLCRGGRLCPPRQRGAALPRQSVPLPQISVKITTISHQILCTYPKCGNFAGNGCAGGGGVLYSDRQSHTRGAPMGAGFFSYLFRKRITGRLRNKF